MRKYQKRSLCILLGVIICLIFIIIFEILKLKTLQNITLIIQWILLGISIILAIKDGIRIKKEIKELDEELRKLQDRTNK